MSASIRSIRRGLDLKPVGAGLTVLPGDLILTLVAYGPDGIQAALMHLLTQFPDGYQVEIIPGPLVPKPKREEVQAGPSKILRPAPQPGVVGAAQPPPPAQPTEVVQSFNVIAIAPGPSSGGRVLPMPDPRNSPNGDPAKH